VPIANGANKIYGAKISSSTPIITEPKQNANHEIKAVIARPQIANPAIKLKTPTITLIFSPNDIRKETSQTAPYPISQSAKKLP